MPLFCIMKPGLDNHFGKTVFDLIYHFIHLFQFWMTIYPDTKLQNRVSDDWKELGFQGDDPKTDFRGMGILGLNQPLYVIFD